MIIRTAFSKGGVCYTTVFEGSLWWWGPEGDHRMELHSPSSGTPLEALLKGIRYRNFHGAAV